MIFLLRLVNLMLSLANLLRLITLMALIATTAALVLGRTENPAPGARTPLTVAPAVVSGYPAVLADEAARWLDSRTGRWKRLSLPEGDRIAAASCAPWRDPQGRFHVVGRWTSSMGQGVNRALADVGLIRCAVPGGEVLDRIASEVFPIAPPCWYPGTSARVLFAAADGQLYEHDFDRAVAHSPREPRPKILRWSEGLPSPKDIYAVDVSRPADPRLANYVLVALSRRIPSASALSSAQIWWLELDPSGTTVERAARLTVPEDRGSVEPAERRPSLAAGPDGSLVLAYLVGSPGQPGWRLRVAAVSIDVRTGTPSAAGAEEPPALPASLTLAPVFTDEGRSILAFFSVQGEPLRLLRVPLGTGSRSVVAHERDGTERVATH